MLGVARNGQGTITFQSYADAYDQDFEDVRHRAPDLTRLRKAINFEPSYTLEAIIREVVQHVRTQLRRQA